MGVLARLRFRERRIHRGGLYDGNLCLSLPALFRLYIRDFLVLPVQLRLLYDPVDLVLGPSFQRFPQRPCVRLVFLSVFPIIHMFFLRHGGYPHSWAYAAPLPPLFFLFFLVIPQASC